jgi:hypothetical protein
MEAKVGLRVSLNVMDRDSGDLRVRLNVMDRGGPQSQSELFVRWIPESV